MSWNNLGVEETEQGIVIKSGVYDGGGKAIQRVAGFDRTDESNYERFEQVVHDAVYEIAEVIQTLYEIGWKRVVTAPMDGLGSSIGSPERLDRVVLLAYA